MVPNNPQVGLAALEAEELGAVVDFALAKLSKSGHPCPLSVEEAETALRQYLSLPFLMSEGEYAVSSTVDELWHGQMLMSTRAFDEFCERVYGCRMHHTGLHPDDEPEFERVGKLYQQARTVLAAHYGEEHLSPNAWPVLTRDNLHDVVVCFMNGDR